MSTRTALAGGIALACLSYGAAAVAASSSASLTNISMTVVDLDLADGITAGFSFVEGLGFAGGLLVASGFGLDDRRDYGEGGLTDPFVSASAAVSVPRVQASAVMTPSGFTLSASTAAPSSAHGDANFIASLSLTPHTRLIATADYSLTASALDACIPGLCEEGNANVFLVFDQDFQAASARAVARQGGGVFSTGPKSGSLQLQVDNVADTTANVGMHFGGSARAEGAVGAIPEPETYALMLIGLGVLGMASRRRN